MWPFVTSTPAAVSSLRFRAAPQMPMGPAREVIAAVHRPRLGMQSAGTDAGKALAESTGKLGDAVASSTDAAGQALAHSIRTAGVEIGKGLLGVERGLLAVATGLLGVERGVILGAVALGGAWLLGKIMDLFWRPAC